MYFTYIYAHNDDVQNKSDNPDQNTGKLGAWQRLAAVAATCCAENSCWPGLVTSSSSHHAKFITVPIRPFISNGK